MIRRSGGFSSPISNRSRSRIDAASFAPRQGQSVDAKGLSGGEDVIVDGQLLLSEGTLVATRARKAGA